MPRSLHEILGEWVGRWLCPALGHRSCEMLGDRGTKSWESGFAHPKKTTRIGVETMAGGAMDYCI